MEVGSKLLNKQITELNTLTEDTTSLITVINNIDRKLNRYEW